MRPYVNGQLAQLGDDVSWRDNTHGFNANGPFAIGRGKRDDEWTGQWPRVIDDVWAFQGVLPEADIRQLAAGFIELPTDRWEETD